MVTTHREPAITTLGAERRAEWDALVAREPTFGLLQSWGWGTFKERMGWRVVRVAAERDGALVAGAQVLVKRLGPAAFAYVPRGPVGAWLDAGVANPLLSAVRRVAREHRAVVLRVEPASPADSTAGSVMRSEGFRSGRGTNQPRATIIVDMADGSEQALARMHQKARYNIRRAERQGVQVRLGGIEDLPAMHRMMQITGERAGFRVRDLAYYRTQWETLAPTGCLRLFIASHDGLDLAMNVSAIHGRIGAYLHGASANLRRDLNPNEYLMWDAMRWAESEGCTAFDLWGVPDEVGEAALAGEEVRVPERLEGLWGVYGFKRRMGQRVELYTPAHDLSRPSFLAPWVGRLAASG
ncbi:MAG: peptidoglycan bridge formation glycyltransferase FemA/FemB family protein [Actinomycetota bacterium]